MIVSDGLVVEGLQCLDGPALSFSVGLGGVVGVSGASGSGKSMLLRAIADLLPSKGQVIWNGTNRFDWSGPDWRRRVGLLPAQSYWWSPRVGDHFFNKGSGWLAKLGFEVDVLQWEVSRLSSGEQQRLALIRLLDRGPECLLLDEPTAHLDATNVERIRAVVHEFLGSAETQRAAVVVSHDPDLLAGMGGEQWVLGGKGLSRSGRQRA